MKDGSMFAALLNYADDTFWEEHPTIRFDTLEETGTYQVLAAFYIDVSLSEDGVAFSLLRIHGSTRRSHLPRVSRSGRGQGAL